MGNLSNAQVEIIKLFNYDLDNTQLDELKDVLSDYFAKKTTEEMDKFIEQNNLGEEDIETWADEHLRKRK